MKTFSACPEPTTKNRSAMRSSRVALRIGALLLAALTLGPWRLALAATVTWTPQDITGSTLSCRLLFTPTNVVLNHGTAINIGPAKNIAAGTTNTTLLAGDYTVSSPDVPYRLPFKISVPDDSGTYLLTALRNPPVTYTYTNRTIAISTQVRPGTNLTASTNNAGTVNEYVTFNATAQDVSNLVTTNQWAATNTALQTQLTPTALQAASVFDATMIYRVTGAGASYVNGTYRRSGNDWIYLGTYLTTNSTPAGQWVFFGESGVMYTNQTSTPLGPWGSTSPSYDPPPTVTGLLEIQTTNLAGTYQASTVESIATNTINAANITTGTLPNARLGLTVVTNVTLSASNAGIASIAGNVLSIGTNLPASGSSGLASTNGIYYVWNHGILPSNADNTTALTNLLYSIHTNGNVTAAKIVFGDGKYTISNCIEIPYFTGSVGNPARNKSYRFTGVSTTMGQTSIPTNGSILRLLGTNMIGKIVSRGMGGIEFDHLTFYNDDVRRCTNPVGEYVPFIRTVLTTAQIKQNNFIGPTQGLSAKQDAIKGGTDANPGYDFWSGNDNGAFQGYLTLVAENYFNRIRECTRWYAHCNATVIRDNNVWNECGGDSGAFVAWTTNGTSNGHMVMNNLIELTSYTNGIVWGTNAAQSVFIGNTFYDPAGTFTQNAYCFSNGSAGNVVYSGFIDAGFTPLSGAGAASVTYIAGSPTFTNQMPNRYLFSDSQPVMFQSSSGEFYRATTSTGTTNTWRGYIGGDSSYIEFANAGTAGTLIGTNAYYQFQILATNAVYFKGGHPGGGAFWIQPRGVGQLMLVSGATSKELWLGDVTNQRFYILNGVWYRTVSGKGYSNPWGTIFAWTASADQSAAQAAGVTFTNNAAGVGEVRVTGSTINNLTNLASSTIFIGTNGTLPTGLTTGTYLHVDATNGVWLINSVSSLKLK